MRLRGFTLVELVMVMTITGIIAASLAMFLKPAIDSYFDTRRRAELTDMADTALRRMAQDIRRAVPNSIRSVSPSCFELVPTTTGGRYRMAVDTVNGNSAALDISTSVTSFDVLTPMTTVPAANDWIVINNQNGGDVYAGDSRGQITGVTIPATTAGRHRIALTAHQFSPGYDFGRFAVVSNTERAVFYSCVDGTLYRTITAFDADQVVSCALKTGAIVATDVAGCTFVYDPGAGATQQSGFVWLRLQLKRQDEAITLVYGAHVDNVP